MAARYHFDPRTGRSGECTASVRPCPLGLAPEEHFASADEARRGYEATMRALLLPKPLNGAGREAGAAAPSSPGGGEAVSTTKEGLPSRSAPEEAAALVGQLLAKDGSFSRPPASFKDVWKFDEAAGEYVVVKPKAASPEGFTFLNGGIDYNAYLTGDGSRVVKVPNGYSGEEGYDKGAEVGLLAKQAMDKAAYEALDGEALKSLGVRYAETSFEVAQDGQGHSVPVMVQEYLPPEDYEPHDLPNGTRLRLMQSQPLYDLHAGNVRRHKGTGEVVLFDCLRPNGVAAQQ